MKFIVATLQLLSAAASAFRLPVLAPHAAPRAAQPPLLLLPSATPQVRVGPNCETVRTVHSPNPARTHDSRSRRLSA